MCVVFISIYHPCRISSGFSEFRLHFSRESERFGVVNLCEDDRRVIDYASIRGTEIISLRTGHKFERVAKKCDAILSAVFRLCKTNSSYIDVACGEFNVFCCSFLVRISRFFLWFFLGASSHCKTCNDCDKY